MIFAPATFSDTSASSTCQMVFDILWLLGMRSTFGMEAATCLYTGVVTDSGSFRYRSTTPHTMRVAADLMERGVDIDRVHGAIMDTNSEERLKSVGLHALSAAHDGPSRMRTAVLALSNEQVGVASTSNPAIPRDSSTTGFRSRGMRFPPSSWNDLNW